MSENSIIDVNDEELYSHCLILEAFKYNLYAYAPKNELDIELYNLMQNMEILKKDNIILSENMNHPYIHCEYNNIGNINLFNDEYAKCSLCNLILPIDLEFATLSKKPLKNLPKNKSENLLKNDYLESYNLDRKSVV